MSTETIPQGQEQAPAPAELPNGAAAPPSDGAAASAEPAATPEASAQPSEPAKPEPPEQGRAQKRYSDLARERNAAREEAAYWRGIAQAARMGQNAPQPPQDQPNQPQAQADPEPNAANYAGKEFDPAYLRDVARWEGRQEARKLAEEDRKSRQRETEQEVQAREFEEGRKRYIETKDEGVRIEEQFPQYAGVVTEAVDEIARMEPPNTPGRLIDLITLTENRAWVVAALKTKPGLLQQIASLPPTSRALAIGKIDAQISANLASAPAQPAPQAHSPAAPAPAQPTPAASGPPPTLNGRGAAPSIDPNKASMDDYIRWRQAQESQPH